MAKKLFLRSNAVYEAETRAIQNDIEITDAIITSGTRITAIDFSDDDGGGWESSIEVAATYAAVSPALTKRLIYVTADENNFDSTSLYIHNGTTMKFLQTIAVFIICLLSSFFSIAQTPQTTVVVPSVSTLQIYTGYANRIYVSGTNTDYSICSPCTVGGDTVLAGAGGRKWKRVTPIGGSGGGEGLDATLTINNETDKVYQYKRNDDVGGTTFMLATSDKAKTGGSTDTLFSDYGLGHSITGRSTYFSIGAITGVNKPGFNQVWESAYYLNNVIDTNYAGAEWHNKFFDKNGVEHRAESFFYSFNKAITAQTRIADNFNFWALTSGAMIGYDLKNGIIDYAGRGVSERFGVPQGYSLQVKNNADNAFLTVLTTNTSDKVVIGGAGLVTPDALNSSTNILTITGQTILNGGGSYAIPLILESTAGFTSFQFKNSASTNGYIGYVGATMTITAGGVDALSATSTSTTIATQTNTPILNAPILQGGSTGSGTLTLKSTTNATKGQILFGNSSYDEANNILNIGTATSITDYGGAKLQVKSSGSSVDTWRGRGVFGGDNVVVFAAEYNSKATLAAHNSALSAWADIYINPSNSTTETYIGTVAGSGTGLIIDNSNGLATFGARIKAAATPTYADEAAATAGGLTTGTHYKTATGELRIKL